MRHLNNQHNMKLYEVFESENSLYIIFELLDGGQLFEKIKVRIVLFRPKRSLNPNKSRGWCKAFFRVLKSCTLRT